MTILTPTKNIAAALYIKTFKESSSSLDDWAGKADIHPSVIAWPTETSAKSNKVKTRTFTFHPDNLLINLHMMAPIISDFLDQVAGRFYTN